MVGFCARAPIIGLFGPQNLYTESRKKCRPNIVNFMEMGRSVHQQAILGLCKLSSEIFVTEVGHTYLSIYKKRAKNVVFSAVSEDQPPSAPHQFQNRPRMLADPSKTRHETAQKTTPNISALNLAFKFSQGPKLALDTFTPKNNGPTVKG